MAHKALIFGSDNSCGELKPLYEREVKRGNLELVTVEDAQTFSPGEADEVDFVIVSATKNFYSRIKLLETLGIPRSKIIDGRVFQTAGFDFPRFVEEGIAYGTLNRKAFKDKSRCIYQRVFSDDQVTLKLGAKSVIGGLKVHIRGDNFQNVHMKRVESLITVGKFCAIANDIFCYMAQTKAHNYKTVTNYALTKVDWEVPKRFLVQEGICEINIGNDVWLGGNCTLKSINPKKPLVIGDGAIVATDSVVVKNVPPYAIVGGNPAQIIKFRFPEDVIEAMLRIKWWDWSLEKIHDNFKYFNDIERFVALHDK